MSDQPVTPRNPDAPPQRKHLLDRAHILTAIVTALVTCGLGIASLHLTRRGNAEEQKLAEAQVILQAAKDFGKEEPEVVKPVVKGLKDAGQLDAAKTLDAVAKQSSRARPRLTPVALPRHRDSAEVRLAQLEQQLNKQPALSPNLVVRSDGRPAGEPRIQVLPILPGSETAVLPSGETVSRSGSGRLWRDNSGNIWCVGSSCGASGACCRMVLDEQ